MSPPDPPENDEPEPEARPGASHGWAGPSRSQKKRDAHAVGDVGEELTRLSPATLKRLPIDDELRQAVELCRGMQKGALARQLRRIAKLLRSRDHAAIAQAVVAVGQPTYAEVTRDKQAEGWRERLLAGGDAELSALFEQRPEADRQVFRQLVRQARLEPDGVKGQRARRDLFRQLRILLAAPPPDAP